MNGELPDDRPTIEEMHKYLDEVYTEGRVEKNTLQEVYGYGKIHDFERWAKGYLIPGETKSGIYILNTDGIRYKLSIDEKKMQEEVSQQQLKLVEKQLSHAKNQLKHSKRVAETQESLTKLTRWLVWVTLASAIAVFAQAIFLGFQTSAITDQVELLEWQQQPHVAIEFEPIQHITEVYSPSTGKEWYNLRWDEGEILSDGDKAFTPEFNLYVSNTGVVPVNYLSVSYLTECNNVTYRHPHIRESDRVNSKISSADTFASKFNPTVYVHESLVRSYDGEAIKCDLHANFKFGSMEENRTLNFRVI